MAQKAFEEVVEDFEFLEDWEDRYRMVIEMGKAMEPMPDALKTPATKVHGCQAQVWLYPKTENGIFHFLGDSDGIIQRGLISLLSLLYDGLPISQVAEVDARMELGRLGLESHLTRARSDGLAAMIKRIRESAT
ncbi:cysteine desufuration protein SufE [Sagittula sp. P11]|uniref:SufE family protein n=1 Tax=Sagittula sp. P11 TaxID=2009329 RepID=UPI000C2D26E4|nr:SufE family protein [Sagittula sp. P11]AUC55580.1 cysteine desufuration protein SufE [Sagittula sp. P11]